MAMDKHLEPAYKMRQAHDEQRRREAARHPVSGEALGLGEHDRPLEKILNDKHHYELFINTFLAKRDPEKTRDIIQARVDKQLFTDEQLDFLEDARKDYNQRYFEARHVISMLTPEHMGKIARTDERMARLVGQVGENSAPAFISGQIEEMAMTDEDGFQRMVSEFKTISSIEQGDRAKANEAILKARLEKYGISQDTYTKATVAGTTGESRKNLNKLVSEQYKGFWKGLNFATFGLVAHLGRGRRLYNSLEERTRLLSECDQHLAAIATVLHGTLNDEVRLQIENQAFEGTRGVTPRNVLTIADIRRIKNEATPESRKARYTKERDNLAQEKFPARAARSGRAGAGGTPAIPAKKWTDLLRGDKTTIAGDVTKLQNKFIEAELRRHEQYADDSLIGELVATFFPANEGELRAEILAIN